MKTQIILKEVGTQSEFVEKEINDVISVVCPNELEQDQYVMGLMKKNEQLMV